MSNKEMSELSKPVAWQYRYSSFGIVGEWKTVQDELLCNMRPDYERRPIFTAPPAPAVPHGLIFAINHLLDVDGSRGCYSAVECHDAREKLERLLAAAPENTASHGLHQEQPSP